MTERTEVIKNICESLLRGDKAGAQNCARKEYPFKPFQTKKGSGYSEFQSMQIFIRDGLIDRYSGDKLLFPGILRLLSNILPEEFPFRKNWKMTETHIVYWELFPTIDHVIPVAHGGNNDKSNLVTTSMQRNLAKLNSTIDELGWKLQPAGQFNKWDGLTGLFLNFAYSDSSILNDPYLKRWHNAAIRALKIKTDG